MRCSTLASTSASSQHSRTSWLSTSSNSGSAGTGSAESTVYEAVPAETETHEAVLAETETHEAVPSEAETATQRFVHTRLGRPQSSSAQTPRSARRRKL